MTFSLRLATPSTDLPVSLREAKAQVEIPMSSTDRDDQLVLLIDAARKTFERMTRRSLLPQTWVYERNNAVSAIELPRPPLVSITSVESRELLTDAWTAVGAENYTLESGRQPARLTWVDQIPRRVRVTYVAGYANANAIPADFKLSILQLIAFYLENRGDVNATMPIALQGLIEGQRAGTRSGYWYA